jgi:hypothetical protein
MLKKAIVAVALTLTLASATTAFAAPRQDRWMGAYNSDVNQQTDDVLFNRAKGGIE